MTADPAPDCAILGYRQDRIGARIVGLLNVLRLAQDFGVEARFLWLAQPGGPYPELADPRDFLDPGFVARHVTVVGERPDLSARRNLSAEASRMDRALLAQSLAEGARYHSDAAFGILRMIDESAVGTRARMAQIMAALPLSEPLQQELVRARRRLRDRAGEGPVAAIHVRRGDILDGLPWSLSSWPSKYVPDEFFRAWVAGQEGLVIAFSDTPGAVRHLAAGDRRIVPIGEILELDRLTPAGRDVLELMVMAGCARIGAPAGSAFSRAAEIVGLARVDGLPGDLPTPARIDAYDTLLDRVMHRPDSFFAPGDLAQSMQYAANHALGTGQGAALLTASAGREALARAHPFVRRIRAVTAISIGDEQTALDETREALADDRLQKRDRVQCRQIRMFVELGEDGGGTDAAFLGEVFQPRRQGGPIVPLLAARVLNRPGAAATAMMFRPLAGVANAGGGVCAQSGVEPAAAPPLWLYLMDWEELLPNDAARQPIRQVPELIGKLRFVSGPGSDIEATMDAGGTPDLPDDPGAVRLLGLYGACLSLHGRYRRALRLLHWLDRLQPEDPLTIKRLADTCFRLQNRQAGMGHLDRALALSRDNPLLHLSKSRRMAEQGRPRGALHHLARAEALWPGLWLCRQQRRLVEQALKPTGGGRP